jgi:queuine tRNA-ribosyltransferase
MSRFYFYLIDLLTRDIYHRVRGHHLPAAQQNQPRRMPRMYGRLDDAAQKFTESQSSSVVTPDTDAEGLERHGFAEKI